jgi:hypothetical protein
MAKITFSMGKMCQYGYVVLFRHQASTCYVNVLTISRVFETTVHVNAISKAGVNLGTKMSKHLKPSSSHQFEDGTSA